MKRKLGVLLITYARCDLAINTINKIISNNIDEIFIWIDGGKTAEVMKKQQMLHSYLQKTVQKNPKINFHIYNPQKNYGAGASVIAATTLLFENVQDGLILEDDLIVNSNFVHEFQVGMDLISNRNDVWMVTGTRLFKEKSLTSWELLNYPVAWGWGTTSEKWKEISKSLFDNSNFRQIEGMSRRGFWKVGHKRATSGATDAWDTPLAAVMYSLKKCCLVPPLNTISNVGFDSNATHTKLDTWPLNQKKTNLQEGKIFRIDEDQTRMNNVFYEQEVFKIKTHHAIAPIYNFVLKILRMRSGQKNIKLKTKVEMALAEVRTKEIQ